MNPMDINDRVAAFRDNPQGLQQRYAMSQDLLDLMALQKITKEKQDVARQMQLDAAQQGTPPTVAKQLEGELVSMTKEEMAKQMGGLGQQQMRSQGIAGLPAPNMSPQALATGGVVRGFSGGGETASPASQRANRSMPTPPEVTQERLRTLQREYAQAEKDGRTKDVEALTREMQRVASGAKTTEPSVPGVTTKWGAESPDVIRGALVAEYNKAIAAKNREDADAISRELTILDKQLGRAPQGGASPQAAAAAAAPIDKSPIPLRQTSPAQGAYPETAAVRDAAGPAPELSIEQLTDKYLRSQLTADPAVAEDEAAKRFNVYGDQARKVLAEQMAQHSQGLASLQAAQAKEAEVANQGLGPKSWADKLVDVAGRMPPGQDGLTAFNAASTQARADDAKRAQAAAALGVSHAEKVNAYVQAGWTRKDAELKVAELEMGARNEGRKTVLAGKKDASKEVMDLQERKAAAAGRRDQTRTEEMRNLQIQLAGVEADLNRAAKDPTSGKFMDPTGYAVLEQRKKSLLADLDALRAMRPGGATANAGSTLPAGVDVSKFKVNRTG